MPHSHFAKAPPFRATKLRLLCDASHRATESATGQAVLNELLTELARALLPCGVTPARFNEFAKHGFVRAAASYSRLQNGKVSQSGVAVLTGLRRSEIKKILAEDLPEIRSNTATQTSVETVTAAWRVNRRYVDKRGRPKRLPIKGGTVSFASLVKQFGGDVPHHAVLNELIRIGVVRQVGKHAEILDLSILNQRKKLASLAGILPALIDGLRIASSPRANTSPPSMRRLTIPAHSLVELEIIRQRCVSSIGSTLHGLDESLREQLVAQPKTKRAPHSCTVTVLFVENKLADPAPAPHRRANIVIAASARQRTLRKKQTRRNT